MNATKFIADYAQRTGSRGLFGLKIHYLVMIMCVANAELSHRVQA